MPGVRERDDDGSSVCAECEQRPPVGPCAACEAMICADCGVMTRDPTGQRVICASCANLVADVSRRKLERRPRSTVTIAVALVIAICAGAAAILLGN